MEDQSFDITAIINVYKRPYTLDEQICAIKAQTITPKFIFIWNNGNTAVDFTKYKSDPQIRIFDNNANYGVWSRFLIGFLAPTKYICVFDDDTIPGRQWFANCVRAMKEREALYGTIGVVFGATTGYKMLKRYGWDGPSTIDMPVDIVGHSWFFKKSWLSYFVREAPQVHESPSNGEDLHFSFMLQKYANIPTYVPAHPPGKYELWGSQPKTAWAYGCDGMSETGPHLDRAQEACTSRGFRVLIQRTSASSADDFEHFRALIRMQTPFAVVRPADGEYAVLQNKTLTNIDGWTFCSGGRLSRDLEDAIKTARDTCCYVGIPCGECNKDMARWYVEHFHLHPTYTTFANIFVNANWRKWIQFLKEERVPFISVGPGPYVNMAEFCMRGTIVVPPMLVNTWDANGEDTITSVLTEVSKHQGSIFLFSCGPIAKILVAHAWQKHPHNIYLDVGSSLDLFIKGSTNRLYTEGEGFARKVCHFSPDIIRL